MRFFALTLVFSLYAGMALADAQGWAVQLQKNVAAMQAAGNVTANGQVTAADEGGTWRATLPPLIVKNADSSIWSVPSIIMTRPANGAATKIILPSRIVRKISGKDAGTLTIGQQSLNGTWSEAGIFQSLAGQLGQVALTDREGKAGIQQIQLGSANSNTLILTLDGISGSSLAEGKAYDVQIDRLESRYEFRGGKGFGIEQIVGLLQQNYLASAKNPVAINASARGIANRYDGVTSQIQEVKADILVTPKGNGKTADVTQHIVLNGLSRRPAGMTDVVLPKTAETTGRITNLPTSLLSLSLTEDTEAMKREMAKAGTRVMFDDIQMTTQQGARMTGNGTLSASSSVPSGFVGRLNFRSENLASTIQSIQQSMSKPGADVVAQGQAVVGLLVMQGFGTQQNTSTQYVLDFTADGQILMNGQDVSGLVGGVSGAKQMPKASIPGPNAPKVPVTPVQTGEF